MAAALFFFFFSFDKEEDCTLVEQALEFEAGHKCLRLGHVDAASRLASVEWWVVTT